MNTSSGEDEEQVPVRVLSPKQAMKALGVSKATLFGLLRTGELPSILLGPRIRKIRIEEIDAYLDRKTAEQAASHPERKAS